MFSMPRLEVDSKGTGYEKSCIRGSAQQLTAQRSIPRLWRPDCCSFNKLQLKLCLPRNSASRNLYSQPRLSNKPDFNHHHPIHAPSKNAKRDPDGAQNASETVLSELRGLRLVLAFSCHPCVVRRLCWMIHDAHRPWICTPAESRNVC